MWLGEKTKKKGSSRWMDGEGFDRVKDCLSR